MYMQESTVLTKMAEKANPDFENLQNFSVQRMKHWKLLNHDASLLQLLKLRVE